MDEISTWNSLFSIFIALLSGIASVALARSDLPDIEKVEEVKKSRRDDVAVILGEIVSETYSYVDEVPDKHTPEDLNRLQNSIKLVQDAFRYADNDDNRSRQYGVETERLSDLDETIEDMAEPYTALKSCRACKDNAYWLFGFSLLYAFILFLIFLVFNYGILWGITPQSHPDIAMILQLLLIANLGLMAGGIYYVINWNDHYRSLQGMVEKTVFDVGPSQTPFMIPQKWIIYIYSAFFSVILFIVMLFTMATFN